MCVYTTREASQHEGNLPSLLASSSLIHIKNVAGHHLPNPSNMGRQGQAQAGPNDPLWYA